MTVEVVEQHQVFGGQVTKYRHYANTLDCDMTFTLFLPQTERPIPLIWWLSGLTCTDDNFNQKSGFHQYAAEHQVAVLMPDTSPRGSEVADSEAWDLGQGASFYVNAVQEPWASHYRMYDYLVEELPQVVTPLIKNFNGTQHIMGHSMGGHGALMIGLKNPQQFQSISAFAPISHPSAVPWGQKAFTAYLGDNQTDWAQWDATELVKQGTTQPILITQGTADPFYEVQLQAHEFLQAAEQANVAVTYKQEPGYDHSYFMIATFMKEHFDFHCQ